MEDGASRNARAVDDEDTMSNRLPDADAGLLRKAFGTYVTGVTVVTTIDASGVQWGFTANSFTSVSLDPPIVLVCLAHTARSYPAFSSSRHFAVNVLAADQQPIAKAFAGKSADKFEGVAWRSNDHGIPLIDDVAAQFCCEVHERIPAGDHLMLLGRVVAFTHSPRDPLGYYKGGFARVTPDQLATQR